MNEIDGMRLEYGRWRPVNTCAECAKVLNANEKYHNGGICPYCGYRGGVTVAGVRTHAERPVYRVTRRWWLPWWPKRELIRVETK